MFALLLPLLNSILGGLINPLVKAWVQYKGSQLVTTEQGFAAGASADAQIMTSAIAADVQLNALKVQVYGHWINRFVMAVVGIPVALHFSLVIIDTILASHLLFGHAIIGIPPLPGSYSLYEWAIVSSFFLIQGIHLGTSNVTQWLARK